MSHSLKVSFESPKNGWEIQRLITKISGNEYYKAKHPDLGKGFIIGRRSTYPGKDIAIFSDEHGTGFLMEDSYSEIHISNWDFGGLKHNINESIDQQNVLKQFIKKIELLL